MDTYSSTGNWQLTVRRLPDSVQILRAVTCDENAILPDTIFGLPVTVLADHALARGAAPAEGERIQLVCGIPSENWDNTKIHSMRLPDTLRCIGDYAFLHCRSLERLEFSDSVEKWGSGVLLNCGSLTEITFFLEHENCAGLAFLLEELNRELAVTVRTGTEKYRLWFPYWSEDYEENGPAHHFDYQISGSGYPYHRFCRNRILSTAAYDALWDRFLTAEHEVNDALRIAWYRLRFPSGLAIEAKEKYAAWLRDHMDDAVKLILLERDCTGLRTAAEIAPLSEEQRHRALVLARSMEDIASVAVLLELGRHSAPKSRSFEL